MIKNLWIKLAVLCLFMILLVFPDRPLLGNTTGRFAQDDVVVLFDASLRSAAAEVIRIYPSVTAHLKKTLGWATTFKPTILLTSDREQFQRAARSEFVVAFAVPRRNLMVIDYSRMVKDPFSIEVTLRHELCHLLLHHHIQGDRLPKWLDEGVAQWVSGGIGEFLMEQKESILDAAVLAGNLLDLKDLTRTFPGDRKSLSLAYQESRSIVDYLVDKYGAEGLAGLLSHLQGHEIEEALQIGLSVSLDELQEGWKRHLKERLTWFTFLANHLYEILFFLGGVLVVCAFIRQFLKKRAYMQDEESQT